MESSSITTECIADGLTRLGLSSDSSVIVHASMRSFGFVDGGAATIVDALTAVCGTVVMMAGSGDLTKVPAPPGLVRPDNAYFNAPSWADFDHAVATATSYRDDLPVSHWLGQVAEQLRTHRGAVRGPHPLYSFVAVGKHAEQVIAAEHLDNQLGPIKALAEIGGDVLLLGVDHTSNTTIHLAEQQVGRGRFYRYARDRSGLWVELPNVSGESHRFDEIEPHLRAATVETTIGTCRARRVAIADVIATTQSLIAADPTALLCNNEDCRCVAGLRQLQTPR